MQGTSTGKPGALRQILRREFIPPTGRGTAAGMTRIFLSPIAAPSVLGLYGFAISTFFVAANLARWFGGPASAIFLAPFAFAIGGIAQFLAGMWAYRARDALATAAHGIWGAFWIGFGIFWFLVAAGVIIAPILPGPFPELGFLFLALAITTWLLALAAFGLNLGLFGVLATLGAGAFLLFIALIIGSLPVQIAAAWLLLISAFIAWYTATALLFEEVFGLALLPLGRIKGQLIEISPVTDPAGEPGVLRGQ